MLSRGHTLGDEVVAGTVNRDRERSDCLRSLVMQFASESVALVLLGGDHLAGQDSEMLCALLDALFEDAVDLLDFSRRLLDLMAHRFQASGEKADLIFRCHRYRCRQIAVLHPAGGAGEQRRWPGDTASGEPGEEQRCRDTDRTPQEQFAFQLPWERERDIDRLLQADHEARIRDGSDRHHVIWWVTLSLRHMANDDWCLDRTQIAQDR